MVSSGLSHLVIMKQPTHVLLLLSCLYMRYRSPQMLVLLLTRTERHRGVPLQAHLM